jgi:hypothetical protein
MQMQNATHKPAVAAGIECEAVAGVEPKRVDEADRVVSDVCVQVGVGATGEPQGILGDEPAEVGL